MTSVRMSKGHRFGWVAGLTILVALMVVALVGVLHGTASSPATPAQTGTIDQGAAQVAMGVADPRFAVRVTQLQRGATIGGAPAPGANAHYVTLRVSFLNQSDSQQRADPLDFRLVDALGAAHDPTFLPPPSTSCRQWQRADLYPNGPGSAKPRDADATQAGRSFGPEELCFAAGGDPNGALTLVWDPDVSFQLFDSPTRIPLQ